MFVSQMANHVAPWEDEEGWTHSNCPNGYNFPEMLCSLSRYLGYSQYLEYATKVVTENKEQVYQVYIHLSPHSDRAHILQETTPTLREAYEAAALEALTELCERHSGELDFAPASYLPIHYQADGHWRVQHQQMLEYQREVDGNQAWYGRNVTGGQLATTAEYALNVFNLQQCQKLEIQRLKHQVG